MTLTSLSKDKDVEYKGDHARQKNEAHQDAGDNGDDVLNSISGFLLGLLRQGHDAARHRQKRI
jgi:hypothetical protein